MNSRALTCLRPTELSKASLSVIARAIRSIPAKGSKTDSHRFTLEAILSSLLPNDDTQVTVHGIVLSESNAIFSLQNKSTKVDVFVWKENMSVLELELK